MEETELRQKWMTTSLTPPELSSKFQASLGFEPDLVSRQKQKIVVIRQLPLRDTDILTLQNKASLLFAVMLL